MKIHLAADHAGFEHKEVLKKSLLEKGYEVVDHGAREFEEGDDYPDFVTPCALSVAEDGGFGVIFGGSGEGEAMCANRTIGVRAVAYYGGSREILTLSREHNNANILSIGARFVEKENVLEIVQMWLTTPFSGDERHKRRLAKF